MKNFYLKSFLPFFLFCIAISAKAYDCYVDGIDYNLSGDEATVTDNNGIYVGDITIPETIVYNSKTYRVTGIDRGAFYNCSGLTSITIPSSVTSIGIMAFAFCSGLTSVTIPNSVTTIDYEAFYGCSGLTSVTIGNSVTSIGNCAFQSCSGLTSITIPNSVTSIGHEAFYGCSGLTSVTIGNSVTSIGNCAFQSCSGLTSVTIPNSVTSIGYYAFYDCKSLKSVKSDISVPFTFGSDAFSNISSICVLAVPYGTKDAYITKGWTTSVFEGGIKEMTYVVDGICYGFNSNNKQATVIASENKYSGNVIMPSSVTYNGETYSVTSIGSHAFEDCSGLTSITIPNSVTSIGKDAFAYCTGLNAVHITDLSAWCAIDFYWSFFGGNGWSNPLYFAHRLYLNNKEITDLVIPEGVTSIGNCAFINCSSLTSVTIPSYVTSIGNYAFYGAPKIIFCNSETPPTAQEKSFSSSLAIVPEAYKEKYQAATGWKNLNINSAFRVASKTQTTITLVTTSLLSDQKAWIRSNKANVYTAVNDTLKLTGLKPNKEYTIYAIGKYGDIELNYSITAKTDEVGIYINKLNITNTTIHLNGGYNAGDATVVYSGFDGSVGDEIVAKGLEPGQKYSFTYTVQTSDGSVFKKTDSYTTVAVTANVLVKQITASSATLSVSFVNVIDVTVENVGFEDNGYTSPDLLLTGLTPNTKYSKRFVVQLKDHNSVFKDVVFTTQPLSLITQQPKVISAGNVIVAALANVDEAETNVGFEWRRTDWTNEFASNTGSAYVYDGMMEGYIRNLYTEKLWKFRPYYESASGNRYYGEWVGLDPTNTSYFEPTVHTYASVTVKGNAAEVKGIAQRGTDNITAQGFKYWPSSQNVKSRLETNEEANGLEASEARERAAAVPSDAMTIEVKGQVMTANLTDLAYETTYSYAAFVTTSEGETFYGEEKTFTTEKSPMPDLDGDGRLTVGDITALIDLYLNEDGGSGDIDGDGLLTVSDITTLIDMYLIASAKERGYVEP